MTNCLTLRGCRPPAARLQPHRPGVRRLGRAARSLLVGSAAALLLLPARAARASLTLTTAGTNAGFQLTTFATGFPNVNSYGPLGMAFSGSGMLVSDYQGNVRQLLSMADGQNAGSVTPAVNFGQANAQEVVALNGNYYLARRLQGDLVQLNPDGTLNQVIVTGLHGAPTLSVCPNPVNGHLFVAGGACHKIWDVDPVAKTATVWLDNLPAPQQMALDEDGNVLYVAMDTDAGDIIGIDTVTKETVYDYAQLNPGTVLSKPAGLAIGSGSLAADLFVSCGDGSVWSLTRYDGVATQIASSGSPARCLRPVVDHSLLVTQSDRIVRLIAPQGGAFGYSQPPFIRVAATGSNKAVIYWSGVQGALGYNVYRATASGGENYAAPINGSTLVTTRSFAGGAVYRYADPAVMNGVEYFYTVEAVFPEGSSFPSDESSDIPDASAIPWDDPNPTDVLSAIRAAYSGDLTVADTFTAVGPDGQIYDETQAGGPATLSPPDRTWIRYTNLWRRSDGTYLPLNPATTSTATIQTLITPASDGPFRRVKTTPDFLGVTCQYFLPVVAPGNAVAVPGDNCDLLLGTVNDRNGLDVDGGLILQPGHAGWSAYIHSSLNQAVGMGFSDDRGPLDFAGGLAVNMTVLARPSNAVGRRNGTYPSLLHVETVDGKQRRSLSVATNYPDQPMRMKRLYSIAQRGVTRGYKQRGSVFMGASFFGGSLIPYTSPPTPYLGWSQYKQDGITPLTVEEGSNPDIPGIISWNVISMWDWEDQIRIDLR